MRIAVLTTIQPPTSSVIALAETFAEAGGVVLAIGDRKTPTVDWPTGVEFVSLNAQIALDLTLPRLLPQNHYSRKNIGYLLARRRGAQVLYDTDDDNAPLGAFRMRAEETNARSVGQGGWINAYAFFSDGQIWPRGFPLDRLRERPAALDRAVDVHAPVQQGLVDGSPDVDAIWRLVMDREFRFAAGDSVFLGPGQWCPFNSQSTWWFPRALALAYLPSHVSFRMTDIWRSLVAQRCLWELGSGVVFHAAEAFQDRNPHNLLKDFEQEVPGYLRNDQIRECLERITLAQGEHSIGDNLHRSYEALVREGIVPPAEMALVEAWLVDLQAA